MYVKSSFSFSRQPSIYGSYDSSWQNACFELMGLSSSNLLHWHFSLHTYEEIVICRYIVFLFTEDLFCSWYFSDDMKRMEKFRPELKVTIDWLAENQPWMYRLDGRSCWKLHISLSPFSILHTRIHRETHTN